MRFPRIVAWIAVGIAAVATACSSDESKTTTCVAGDVRPCKCDDGADGTQHCGKTGERYSSCTCVADAAVVTDTAASDVASDAKLPLLSPCMSNAECESNLCYSFPSKGSRCTKNCTGDAECPAPSTGCNPMGVCRVP